MSCSTATISARGTITSSTRRSRKSRMLVSIARSSGEKPVSPEAASSTISRSSRIEPGFQPNSARSMRASQVLSPSRAAARGGDTTTGRWVRSGRSRRLGGPGSAMEVGGWSIGVANAKAREQHALELFHLGRLRIGLVVVADQVQETMNGKVGDMIAERFGGGGRLGLRGLVGNHDVAKMPDRV